MADRDSTDNHSYLMHRTWHYHYAAELNPNVIRFLLAVSGIRPLRIHSACELAYGQGLSIAIHAACNQNTHWTGTDLNPAHVAFAAKLSGDRLANLVLSGEPFDRFFARDDLGSFDVVGMTGTWSWLAREDWAAISGFLSKHMQPRGLFCVDYMTYPGQHDTTALRQLLVTLAGRAPGLQPHSKDAIASAIETATEILELQPGAIHGKASARALLKQIAGLDPGHVEHEYLNYNWHPLYFAEMADIMHAGRLNWLAPWGALEQARDLHFTPRQQARLAALGDWRAAEALKDILCNRGGRRDIWSKEREPLAGNERERLLRETPVVLVRPASTFTFRAQGSLGETALSRAAYEPLLSAMASHQPIEIHTLAKACTGVLDFDELIEAVLILMATDFVHVVQARDKDILAATEECHQLNHRILQLVSEGHPIEHLGSPVTGGGLNVSREHQAFLAAFVDGATNVEDCVARTRSRLPGSTDAVLHKKAAEYIEQYLPIHNALKLYRPKAAVRF